MKLFRIIFAVSSAWFLASCGSEYSQHSSELKGMENKTKVLCSVDGLPKDWIIVGHANDTSCKSRRDWNAYIVKKASEKKETVCSDSNIPAGYVKVKLVQEVRCGYSFRENAFVIEKL